MENCTTVCCQIGQIMSEWLAYSSMAEWETSDQFFRERFTCCYRYEKSGSTLIGNVHASNSSGFSALPGGRMNLECFIYEGRDANFWATDESHFPGLQKQ